MTWWFPVCCGTALMACGCAPSETAWFSEEATARGVDFVHYSGYDGRPMMPEMVGGGAALADFDGDADLDLYLVQSGRVDRTLPDELSRNRLYKNRGDGHFDEVAGAAGAGDRGYGMGVAAGDYDNDGDVDLYVTNLGANVLLQNDGDRTFTDITFDAGINVAIGNGLGTVGADFNGDGLPDLFVANDTWSISSG